MGEHSVVAKRDYSSGEGPFRVLRTGVYAESAADVIALTTSESALELLAL